MEEGLRLPRGQQGLSRRRWQRWWRRRLRRRIQPRRLRWGLQPRLQQWLQQRFRWRVRRRQVFPRPEGISFGRGPRRQSGRRPTCRDEKLLRNEGLACSQYCASAATAASRSK